MISLRSDYVGTDKNLCYWFLFSIFWGIFKEFDGALKFIRCDCVGWSLNGQTFGNSCLKIADILQKHFFQGNCRKELKVNRFCLQIGTVGVLRNVQNFTNSKMLWLVDKWPNLQSFGNFCPKIADIFFWKPFTVIFKFWIKPTSQYYQF